MLGWSIPKYPVDPAAGEDRYNPDLYFCREAKGGGREHLIHSEVKGGF